MIPLELALRKRRPGRAGGLPCEVAKYDRVRLSPAQSLTEIHGSVSLARFVLPFFGRDLGKRERAIFVLVDEHRLPMLVGRFSSKHESLCALKFYDMVPGMNAAMFLARSEPAGLFMAHNHPSGNATFSVEDVVMTKHLTDMHKAMPFGLVDSVIVVKGGAHVSMRLLQELVPSLAAELKDVKFAEPKFRPAQAPG